MNVIVVGCGRLGADLAYRLSKRTDTSVAVVDFRTQAFNNLPHGYNGRIVDGDAMSQDTLVRAGIEEADAVAVVTNSDALNAVVGHIARSRYKVPVVVVRNYDSHSRLLFETFGLQVVSSISWGAQRIEEMLHHSEIRAVFSAGNGEVELYELTVPSTWHGKQVRELVTTSQCIPTSVTRSGNAYLAVPEFDLETGDIVHISATQEGIEALRETVRFSEEA